MAKITPSALITEIKGKWHGDTFQMWKGAIVSHRTGKPRQANTANRAAWKGVASDIAGCYDSLSASDKTSWLCYADLLPTQMSGFNSFLGRNTAAVLANHPGLCLYFSAPGAYSVPTAPIPLCAAYCATSGYFCLAWTTPAGATFYVQAQFAPQVGYSNANYPTWKVASTVAAAQLHLDLDASGYPPGTLIRFRARTLNLYAEPSLWSPTLHDTKT